MNRRIRAIGIPLVAALLLGALLLLATGVDPLDAYGAILSGAFGPDGFADTLSYVIPVAGLATALAIPLRAGMVNLGGEGQLVLGAISAIAAGLYTPGPGWVKVLVALVAAILAGGAYAALAAVCENRFGVPLLISTLLLSYPAMSLAGYLVRFPMKDEGSSLPQSAQLPPGARLPELVGLGIVLLVVMVRDQGDRVEPEVRGLRGNRPAEAHTRIARVLRGDRRAHRGYCGDGLSVPVHRRCPDHTAVHLDRVAGGIAGQGESRRDTAGGGVLRDAGATGTDSGTAGRADSVPGGGIGTSAQARCPCLTSA